MDYTTIHTAIVTLLGQVTELNQVYAYEAKELKKFPCATVTALEHRNRIHDTAGNAREYIFMIRLYYRTDVAADGESIMLDIVDKVMKKIEANNNLNGSCQYAQATEARWLYQEREFPLRVCELQVSARGRIVR